MARLVDILERYPCFQWKQSDDTLPGGYFTTDLDEPGHLDLDGLHPPYETHITVDVSHGYWDGEGWLRSAPSAFLVSQLCDTLVAADYEIDCLDSWIQVRVKPTDQAQLLAHYRELRMDEDEDWRRYHKQWVLRIARERRRMSTVFGVLKRLMRVTRIKRELMAVACQPRRLAQIGLCPGSPAISQRSWV